MTGSRKCELNSPKRYATLSIETEKESCPELSMVRFQVNRTGQTAFASQRNFIGSNDNYNMLDMEL